MSFRPLIALTLLMAGFTTVAEAKWIKLRSSNFELYTSASWRAGRSTIQHFERIRSIFGQGMQWDVSHPLPVRILLFRSKKEYLPFRPGEVAAAFYQRLPDADQIVMVAGSEPSTAIHEYVHLLVRRSGLRLPVWLNEGIAVVYSSMQQVGNHIGVGYAPWGRLSTLESERWPPLEDVLSADHDSEHYTEKEHSGRFYAASWALTHMLIFSSKYRSNYQTLVELLVDGEPSVQAIKKTYGISIDDLNKELLLYVEQDLLLEGKVVEVKLEESAEEPSLERAEDLEVSLMLADLLAYTEKAEEARAMYRDLSKQNPDAPKPYEGLGHLEYRSGNNVQARHHFARAFELGSTSPMMLRRYATLQRKAGDDNLVSTLKRAVKVSPEDIDARLALGNYLIGKGSYSEVATVLGSVRNPTDEQGRSLYGMLAHARWMLEDPDGSRRAAEQLLEIAQAPDEIRYANSLLARLEWPSNHSPETPAVPSSGSDHVRSVDEIRPSNEATPELTQEPVELKARVELDRVQGSFVRLECYGDEARMDIAINGATISFLIDDSTIVDIRGLDSGVMDLNCGKQDPQEVVVGFTPAENADLGTRGLVRTIEFTGQSR